MIGNQTLTGVVMRQNLINSDYPVQPVATKELIEDRGESIYNKSNEGPLSRLLY